MKIELHIIQNFAPACLNRDDVNAPKDCEFGGFRRARISSQCLKRAVRTHWWANGVLEGNRASRTKRVTEVVAKDLAAQGRDPEQAAGIAAFALSACKLKVTDGATEYLLFLGDAAISTLSRVIGEHWDELVAAAEAAPAAEEGGDDEVSSAKQKKKAKKAAMSLPQGVVEAIELMFDGTRAADVALFGRMIADKPDKNVDAACQVAHAISTHPVTMEMDYFTAVDDLQPKEDTGAGMLGYVEFNSACYYRYSLVDCDQLIANLGGDADLARRTLQAYIAAAAEAIPSARQHSMAAHNPPSFVLAVARKSGAPWSLANAFEHPVYAGRGEGESLVRGSIRSLDRYWGRLKRAYGDRGIEILATMSVEDENLESIGDQTKVDSLTELVERVTAALGG